MTIENPNVVDGMGLSKEDGKAALMIYDHLGWDDEKRHIEILENKINAYLGFIRSGQIIEEFPESDGREIRVDLILQHEPSELGFRFLLAAQQQASSQGFELAYKRLPEGY